MLKPLAEADSRVRDNHARVDADLEQTRCSHLQDAPDLGHDVVVGGAVLHVLWEPLHVHDADGAAALRDQTGHQRVG